MLTWDAGPRAARRRLDDRRAHRHPQRTWRSSPPARGRARDRSGRATRSRPPSAPRSRHFCYPEQRAASIATSRRRVAGLLRRLGFRSATTSRPGALRPGADRFALPRLGVSPRLGAGERAGGGHRAPASGGLRSDVDPCAASQESCDSTPGERAERRAGARHVRRHGASRARLVRRVHRTARWRSACAGSRSSTSRAGCSRSATRTARVQVVCNGEIYNAPALRTRARGARPPPADPLRRRGDRAPLRGATASTSRRKLDGMFAFALWDAKRASPGARARPPRHQAALRRRGSGDRLVWGSEAKCLLAGGPRSAARPPGAARLPDARLRPGPAQRSSRASRSSRPDTSWSPSRAAAAARSRRYWQLARARAAPDRAPRSEAEWQRRAACRRCAAAVREPPDERRAARRVPLGRPRLGHHRRAHARARRARRSGRSRSASRRRASARSTQAREVATRYGTEHHELIVRPDAVALAAALVRQLRRAVRRLVGDPGLLRLRARAPAREGRAVGRGRRRGPRRLRDLPRAPARGAVRAPAAGASARGCVPGARAPAAGVARQGQLRLQGEALRHRRVSPARRGPPLVEDDPRRGREGRALRATARPAASSRRRASSRRSTPESDGDELDRLQYIDAQLYLPADILVKVDRMSMAHSLEARVPFLDRVDGRADAPYPARLRLRGMTTKYLLRRAMADRLPARSSAARSAASTCRCRHGSRRAARLHQRHAVPAALRRQGLFEPAAVERLVREHVGAPARSQPRLWTLLVLSVWHDDVLRDAPPARRARRARR